MRGLHDISCVLIRWKSDKGEVKLRDGKHNLIVHASNQPGDTETVVPVSQRISGLHVKMCRDAVVYIIPACIASIVQKRT